MALYDKWGVKTGFSLVLQFFMLISDILGGVIHETKVYLVKGSLYSESTDAFLMYSNR